jgi:hypothetical protein
MKQLAAHDPESVSLYNRELMSAYKKAAFEIFIAVLLIVAIYIINHGFLSLILAFLVVKIYYSWDRIDLIRNGKVTYFKVEEWDNL